MRLFKQVYVYKGDEVCLTIGIVMDAVGSLGRDKLSGVSGIGHAAEADVAVGGARVARQPCVYIDTQLVDLGGPLDIVALAENIAGVALPRGDLAEVYLNALSVSHIDELLIACDHILEACIGSLACLGGAVRMHNVVDTELYNDLGHACLSENILSETVNARSAEQLCSVANTVGNKAVALDGFLGHGNIVYAVSALR